MPDKPNREYQKIIAQFRIVSGIALAVLAAGVVFYHFVEKLSWIDSLYFCTVTLTTIGYGDIAPKTTFGKLFTIFYVLIGVGIIAAFANLSLKRAVARREYKKLGQK